MMIFRDFAVLVLSFAISGFAQPTPQESFERELNSAEERFKMVGKALSVQVRESSEEELELVDMLQGMYPFACPVHPNSIAFEIGGLRQNLRHYGLADAQIDQAVKRFLEMLGLPLKVKQTRGTSPAAFPFASYALKYKLLRVTERGVGEAGESVKRSFLRLHVVYFHRYPKLSDTSNDDWGSLYLKPEGADARTPMILPGQSTFRYPTDAEIEAMPEGRSVNKEEFMALQRQLRVLERQGQTHNTPQWNAVRAKIDSLVGRFLDI